MNQKLAELRFANQLINAQDSVIFNLEGQIGLRDSITSILETRIKNQETERELLLNSLDENQKTLIKYEQRIDALKQQRVWYFVGGVVGTLLVIVIL